MLSRKDDWILTLAAPPCCKECAVQYACPDPSTCLLQHAHVTLTTQSLHTAHARMLHMQNPLCQQCSDGCSSAQCPCTQDVTPPPVHLHPDGCKACCPASCGLWCCHAIRHRSSNASCILQNSLHHHRYSGHCASPHLSRCKQSVSEYLVYCTLQQLHKSLWHIAISQHGAQRPVCGTVACGPGMRERLRLLRASRRADRCS